MHIVTIRVLLFVIFGSLDWLTHNASRIWEVGRVEVRHPERHLSSIPAGRQFSFWLGSLEDR